MTQVCHCDICIKDQDKKTEIEEFYTLLHKFDWTLGDIEIRDMLKTAYLEYEQNIQERN